MRHVLTHMTSDSPILGSFAVSNKGWRWTQWIILFFAAFSILFIFTSHETFHPVLKRRLAKQRGKDVPPTPSILGRIRIFAMVGLIRPVHMLFAEPIVAFICLYVSVNFAILFSFFAAVPYTFSKVYDFSLEQSGLVFLSVVIGCLLSLITILLCDVFIYCRRIPHYPPCKVPPEHRLYPAMLGSLGLPLSMFWYAWTARDGISWASPASAIIPFAWGNLCVFVSTTQYSADTYHGDIVASVASANSLARYAFAGSFPLFIIQSQCCHFFRRLRFTTKIANIFSIVYKRLGIAWATSLLGFLTVALLPVPWVLYNFGPQIRAKSKYKIVMYD